MRLSELGEFKLINNLERQLRNRGLLTKKGKIIVGLGDDAAVVSLDSRKLVVTTDTLVEDVHFKRSWLTWEQIGYRGLVSNISDILAMGAYPRYFLISLAVPYSYRLEDIKKLFKGFERAARICGIKCLGGDTVSSPRGLILSIAVLGEPIRNAIITRGSAREGDSIFVTGNIGDAAAGIEILKRELLKKRHSPIFQRGFRYLASRFAQPPMRLKEGRKIASHHLANAMIDCSDGLALSLKFICESSNVGAYIYINRIPLSFWLKRLSVKCLKSKPFEYALFGGDDYELVFTVDNRKAGRVERLLSGAREIGNIKKARGIRYFDDKGKRVIFKKRGYEHFTR